MTDAAFDNSLDNPFASPQVAAAAIDPIAPKLERTRPWAMLFVGIIVGTIIGATAGGVTSGTMGFVAMLVQASVDSTDEAYGSLSLSPWDALVIGGILGGFQGAWMGGVIGGIVGLVCGTSTPLRMNLPMWLGAILSAIGGGFFGAVAGGIVIVGGSDYNDPRTTAIVAGGAFGLAAGLVAGAFLGRVLYGLAVRWRGVGLAPVFAGPNDNSPPHPAFLAPPEDDPTWPA